MSADPKPAERKMRVEYWKIDRLKPFERNARTHSPLQIEQIASSMREFGWTMPILAGADDVIIAGHGRLLAAKQLDMQRVPVIVADNWTEAQRRAYVLADNQLALNANWDNVKLAQEIEWLKLENFDTQLVGFSDAELANLFPSMDVDQNGEWRGMPEFSNGAIAFRSLIVHFKDQAACEAFAQLIGQEIGPNTKSCWHPPQPREQTHDKRYVSESPQGESRANPGDASPNGLRNTSELVDVAPEGIASESPAPT